MDTAARIPLVLLQIGAVTGWVAVPEFVPAGPGRFAARAGVLALTGAGVAGILTSRDPAPKADAQVEERQAEAQERMRAGYERLAHKMPEPLRPAVPVAVAAAVLGAMVASARLEDAIFDALANRLRSRGVPRPRLWLGLAAGTAIAAQSWLVDEEL